MNFFSQPLAIIIFILFVGFIVALVLPESKLELIRV